MKTTSNGRRTPMDDSLKILKVKYLSNRLLAHTQILNINLYDQSIFCKFKWRRPPMEDDLKILKLEYLSNQIMDHFNFELKLRWQINILQILKIKTTSNGRRPQKIISWISLQLLNGSYSKFKLKLLWSNHIEQILKMKTISDGR